MVFYVERNQRPMPELQKVANAKAKRWRKQRKRRDPIGPDHIQWDFGMEEIELLGSIILCISRLWVWAWVWAWPMRVSVHGHNRIIHYRECAWLGLCGHSYCLWVRKRVWNALVFHVKMCVCMHACTWCMHVWWPDKIYTTFDGQIYQNYRS